MAMKNDREGNKYATAQLKIIHSTLPFPSPPLPRQWLLYKELHNKHTLIGGRNRFSLLFYEKVYLEELHLQQILGQC